MNNDPKKMENSELLANFLISRDNLISIKRAMFEDHGNVHLQELFDSEQKIYDSLLLEVYRRMQ